MSKILTPADDAQRRAEAAQAAGKTKEADSWARHSQVLRKLDGIELCLVDVLNARKADGDKPPKEQMLTGKQKAAHLQITMETLLQWRKAGKIRFIKYSHHCIRYFPGLE